MTAPQSVRTSDFPTLSPFWVRLLIEKTQDLALIINGKGIVTEVFRSDSFAHEDSSHWIGSSLHSIVGPESVGKVDILLSNDLGESTSDDRWRHINLMSATGAFIPVLARYITLKGETRETRIIVLRDLRALRTANERFAEAQRELEFEYSERIRKLNMKDRAPAETSKDGTPVEHVLGKIGRTPLDKVIDETTAALERRCLIAILQESGGKHSVAAKVAKMPLDRWMDLIKKHNLS